MRTYVSGSVPHRVAGPHVFDETKVGLLAGMEQCMKTLQCWHCLARHPFGSQDSPLSTFVRSLVSFGDLPPQLLALSQPVRGPRHTGRQRYAFAVAFAGAGMAMGILLTESWKIYSAQTLLTWWIALPAVLAGVLTRFAPRLWTQYRQYTQVPSLAHHPVICIAIHAVLSVHGAREYGLLPGQPAAGCA